MNRVGIVAIGRNEGDRLRRCLSSLDADHMTVVYVDSGSTDGSRELARSLGVALVDLDASVSFTAARARNAGFNRLLELCPDVEFVQFVDGDCEVVDGWLDSAIAVLQEDPTISVVCGRRRERHPDASIYNQIIDLEWDTPVGEVEACGGDALMRVSSLQQVGGFNDDVAAGEEPEMCARLRKAGSRIVRIDAEMTLHDAAMSRFHQWWRRHVRSGYGGMDVQRRFGVALFDHELTSARVWTIGWTLFWVASVVIGGVRFGPIGGVVGAIVPLGLWAMQMLRIARGFKKRGLTASESVNAAAVTMAIKWANLRGQIQYAMDRRNGLIARSIEYKSTKPTFPAGEKVVTE